MVEGIKFKVHGVELQKVMRDKVTYNIQKITSYEKIKQQLGEAAAAYMPQTASAQVENLTTKVKALQNENQKLGFMADHLDTSETYILQAGDLFTLGIIG